jgi:hypothetical protein
MKGYHVSREKIVVLLSILAVLVIFCDDLQQPYAQTG